MAGAIEFTRYLPADMQSVLVQPIGSEGVLVLGSDYQRGFGRVDQVSHGSPLAYACASVSCACKHALYQSGCIHIAI